jgi:hypothetical protein
MANVVGNSAAWTILTPIVPGQEDELRTALAKLGVGSDSPLAKAYRTHFARWVVLPQLIYQGQPQKPDALRSQYLLFTACCDGPRDSYLDHLRETMGAEADEIWGHCVGYPGSADATKFRAYFQHNSLDAQFFVAAYPGKSVEQVRSALALRDRLIAFATSSQGLDPAAFAAAYRQSMHGRNDRVEVSQ